MPTFARMVSRATFFPYLSNVCCHARACASTESTSVPSISKITAFSMISPRSQQDPLLKRLLLFRDLGAFLARLREPDGDGLFAALHLAALATFAALCRALLIPVHLAFD